MCYKEKFLSNLEFKGKSLNTIETYKYELNNFEIYMMKKFNAINLDVLIQEEKIKYNDLEGYIYYCRENKGRNGHPASDNTINKVISALQSYYKYLGKFGVNDIARYLDKVSIKRKKINEIIYATENDIRKIQEAINTKKYKREVEYCRTRDKLMMKFYFDLGLRREELVNIRFNDIRNGLIRIVGKGDKERFIYMTQSLYNAFIEYINIRKKLFNVKDNEMVFVTVRKSKFNKNSINEWFNNIVDLTDIEENRKKLLTPHKLRHGCGTRMSENGADTETIRKQLGHSNISTTDIYVHDYEGNAVKRSQFY